MFDSENDTIAAICTGIGGALNILRISGSKALNVLNSIRYGKYPADAAHARMMLYGHIGSPDGEPCLAVYMPGPASYTGEDVAEIQCHGGAYAARRALSLALDNGARLAENGEFTRRAFLNGKLDLTQAEGVMELISAGSEQAGKLAEAQLNGVLGKEIHTVRAAIVSLLAESESRLDFSEENLDWTEPEAFIDMIRNARERVVRLERTAKSGSIVREGVRLVIAGAPNAGKSSLMNLMLGYDRAIVTDIPGTTRDTIEESIDIRGIRFRLTDTAGLRDDTDDIVEQQGIRRSMDIIERADAVVLLLDATTPGSAEEQTNSLCERLPKQTVFVPCWNKIDLVNPSDLPQIEPSPETISVKTTAGYEHFLQRLADETISGDLNTLPDFAVSERHAVLLHQAADSLLHAEENVREESWELVGSSLRNAAEKIGCITGETVTPDVLDEIFARFCIGK